jgi:hypothetical protein
MNSCHTVKLILLFLFTNYTCDNFSDLRSKVDDGKIFFTVVSALVNCLLTLLKNTAYFRPVNLYESVQSQGRDILHCFVVN